MENIIFSVAKQEKYQQFLFENTVLSTAMK